MHVPSIGLGLVFQLYRIDSLCTRSFYYFIADEDKTQSRRLDWAVCYVPANTV